MHQVEIPHRLFLEALHHGFEHVERLALVFHQRIVLPVTPKTDALLQVIHAKEMVFPLRIQHAEHDHALVITHCIGADKFFFSVVTFFELVENRITQLLAIKSLGLESFRQHVHTKASENRILQPLQVPVFGMDLGWSELIHQIAQNAGNVIFEDEFLLIYALEQLVAKAIHSLALFVHHVVILEQMLAGFEVLGFDRLLRGFDTPRDKPRLNGDALFHAQPLKQVRNPLLGEDAHQVIFQGQIEAGGAGIALASSTSA